MFYVGSKLPMNIPIKITLFKNKVATEYIGYIVQFIHNGIETIAIVKSGKYFYEMNIDDIECVEGCSNLTEAD